MGRIDTCIDCGEVKEISARDRCKKCYGRWQRAQPGWKEKHAARMRRDRKEKPEIYDAIEKRRSNTTKRKKWQKEYNKKYYAEHREELLAYQVQWRKDNPEQFESYWRNAHARKRNAEGSYTAAQWEAILEYYCPDMICPRCGEPFDKERLGKTVSVDHVIPLTLGGTNYPENLQPLCYSCNCSKGNRSCDDYRFDNGEFARSLQ